MAENVKGYVFRVAPGVVGILRYRPETTVELFETETLGMFAVAVELQKILHTTVDVADRDQIAWGKLFLARNNI